MEVKEAVINEMVSITTDLWTDDFVKRIFLCVTFHFMKESQLILDKLKCVLNDFEVSELENIKFVTDRGANIVKALQNYTRLNCSNHLFNNVLHSAFNNTTELKPMLEACKKLVKYFKKCYLQHMLTTSLKNYCVTRWNSHYNLFKSILNNWDAIQEILGRNAESYRTVEINLSTLIALVELFENFDKISKKLRGANYVTTNYICLSINSLKTICAIKNPDSSTMVNLKTNIIREMNSKWIPYISIYQYSACFLYPPTNCFLEEAVLRDVKDFCVSQILSGQYGLPSPTNGIRSQTINNNDFELFFSEFINSPNLTLEESVSEEVNRYSLRHINIEINCNALEWWDHHVAEYPRLSKLSYY